MSSSVRRILKRGGAKNFRKFGKNKDLNQKLFLSNLVRFFAQNQVKSKKKSSLKFSPIFRPNTGEEQKKKPPKYAPACDCDIISKAKGREVQENSSYLCSEVFTKQKLVFYGSD